MGRRSVRLGMAAGVLLAGGATAPAHAVTPVACTEAALRTAVANSNAGTGDTLVLTPWCLYTLTDAGGGALPQITQPLVIQGNHATIKRDTAASDFRIFAVGGTSLTMDALTVMNGNAGTGNGGGVEVTGGGSLTTTDVNFQGNTAGNRGGAIDVVNPTSTASLTGGTFSDNRAAVGGAMAFTQVQETLTSVTVVRNRAAFAGGGIADNFSTLTVSNCTISSNAAGSGGGGISITNGDAGSPVNITGSTVSDNVVTGTGSSGFGIGGGGIFNASLGATPRTTTITNSTISGNTSTVPPAQAGTRNVGGGVFNFFGRLTLDNTTVRGNRLTGASSQGAGIATQDTLTLQNGTTVTGNLASGQYSQGGGIYAADGLFGPGTVSVTGSHIDTNKVTGTGSAAAGIYNTAANISLTNSSVNNNTAPNAPAPGGIWTDTQFTTTGSAITGNTPTNCLLSPVIPTGCTG